MRNKPAPKIGDTVTVDDPRPLGQDLWNHSFAGEVRGKNKDGSFKVVDGEGDYWDVDESQLQVQD